MLFGRIRRVHGTLQFIHSRSPEYIRLARQDLGAFRREVIEILIGLGVGVAAGMLFLCFLSVAIIVTAWESRYRVLTTWLVCGGWAVLAMAGLLHSRRGLSGPLPFENLTRVLLKDLQVIETMRAQISSR
jgi:ABC-type uncharacterized transport system permease subunit